MNANGGSPQANEGNQQHELRGSSDFPLADVSWKRADGEIAASSGTKGQRSLLNPKLEPVTIPVLQKR